MADPNIVDTTIVKGKTAVISNIATTGTTLLTNTTSNSVYKIGTLIISNIDGVAPYDVSVSFVRSTTPYKIISTVSIPQDSSLVVISRDTSIYLQENDTLQATASSGNVLQAICSYEEIL
jgi:hypothetical protein